MLKYLTAAIVLVGLMVGLAPGWWVKGHESIAEAAVARLPEDVPAFFRAGGKVIAHCAGEPDRWKNPAAKHLRAAEAPDHYIDLEDLQGQDLPADRYKAASLIARLKQSPSRTGMLPYAILENYDRLSCAFKDYRDDPQNPAVQMKCLVYAGILAHYTGDAAMPLHTTRDYDGRRTPDGQFVQKGIHAKIDAFPEKNNFSPEEICRGVEAHRIDDVWAHTIKVILESHSHVNTCYELDKRGAFDKPTDESRAFIMARCRVAAQFTVDLWYSAWLRSKTMPPHY
ncbi:MAG: hypothetical protein NZ700_01470 [Gemmataceae bacterium]|nr:hypothetical protein [Gemmataceae bacterium]MDW8267172.1 hypothetical protein [Gemmataceae bacterium]